MTEIRSGISAHWAVVFPFALYRKSHTTHHRDIQLTVPGVDTESYYVLKADWQRAGSIKRALLTFNQTLVGRMAVGPALRLWALVSKESRCVAARDYSHLPHWAVHACAVALLFNRRARFTRRRGMS